MNATATDNCYNIIYCSGAIYRTIMKKPKGNRQNRENKKISRINASATEDNNIIYCSGAIYRTLIINVAVRFITQLRIRNAFGVSCAKFIYGKRNFFPL